MSKERQNRFSQLPEAVDETKIPQAFDMRPLFEEFVGIANSESLEKAKDWLEKVLPVQLKTLIQEQIFQPLSPSDLYEIELRSNTLSILDKKYPQNPDIVQRAFKSVEYATQQGFYQEIIDRYLLEAQQMQLLVETLSKNPLFSKPLIDQLAQTETFQTLEIENQQLPALVSNWYTLAMPSSAVHAGNRSYLNIYRIVAIKKNDDWKYFLQTQGYFHSHDWKTQVKLVQKDDRRKKKLATEKELMLHIGQLPAEYNRSNSKQVLTALGIQSGDLLLPIKIWKAKKRQLQQQQQIENATQAILVIFEKELVSNSSSDRWPRLQHFFEAIANPLLWNRSIPTAEIVRQYQEILLPTNDRVKFLTSLLGSIPTIANRTGGFFICGSLSAGGLAKNMSAANVNGFGLPPGEMDHCMQCPACGQLSTSGNVCSNCHYRRGQQLPTQKNFMNEEKSINLAKQISDSSNKQESPPIQQSMSISQFVSSLATPTIYNIRAAA